MKNVRIAWVLVFVLASSVFLAAAAPANAAIDAYLKIPGVEGSAKGKWAGWIPVDSINFSMEAARSASREMATGQATGKRMHDPFVVMKHTDMASPKLFEAASSGKHFPTVQVAYVNAAGEVTKRVELTDAILTTRKAGGDPKNEIEEIQFTFQKIEFQAANGNKTAVDDWSK